MPRSPRPTTSRWRSSMRSSTGCRRSGSTCIWIPGTVRTRGLLRIEVVPEFSPGLEGVVAAQTAVSEGAGGKGSLIYRCGILIEDLDTRYALAATAYLAVNGTLRT